MNESTIVKDYIGWPSNVNTIIIDSTSPKFGENATKVDNLDSGLKRSVCKNTYVPDTYNVVMDFDWVKEDENGETEYTRFINWYKYFHKFGTVPFEFKQILYSGAKGVNKKVEDEDGRIIDLRVEYYVITSPLSSQKHGTSVRVTMTWRSVFFGTVQVTAGEEIVKGIQAFRDHCVITFSKFGAMVPLREDFVIYEYRGGWDPLLIDGYTVREDNSVMFSYSALSPGSHRLSFSYNNKSLTGCAVSPGSFTSLVIV